MIRGERNKKSFTLRKSMGYMLHVYWFKKKCFPGNLNVYSKQIAEMRYKIYTSILWLFLIYSLILSFYFSAKIKIKLFEM